jgi:predicted Zn-dependent protease
MMEPRPLVSQLRRRLSDSRIRHRIASLAAGVLLLAGSGCVTNPATGQSQLVLIGAQQEMAMGRQAHGEILASMGAYENEALQRYVAQVGRRVQAKAERPDLPWTFTVVDDPAVNAFALPGGFLYLTRGILAHMTSEAQMAAVLGHEIGHVTARHSVEQMSRAQLAGLGMLLGTIVAPELAALGDVARAGVSLLFLGFSREAERQADDLGLRYLGAAGYDPHGMIEVLTMLDRTSGAEGRLPDWLSTHPNPANRVARLAQRIGAAPRTPTVDEAFLRRIDGLVFGEDPRQGYFRDTRFYHPELAFALRFPSGWKTANQRESVGAASPEGDAVVMLSLSAEGTVEAAAERMQTQEGVVATARRAGTIGGLPAIVVDFGAQTAQGAALRGRAAFVGYGKHVYRILGYAADARFEARRDAISASLASFAPLRDRRYLDVAPHRLALVRVPRATSLESFVREHPSPVDAATIAAINQLAPGERIPAGRLMKRVVGRPLPD